eukprot:CAMPEP_0181365224 /NCGR_PEP_ID=MMETSP1106-20121128/9928_1 /TAXON_ID=81844 /ORGANISM="Mantoniella antarctica, Strain SL-175" /LENGTH=288 /DNA_ID=CAMNT_0023480235 /DNA_START=38 /DNA_END=905 /DNA_ORIENTATION=+
MSAIACARHLANGAAWSPVRASLERASEQRRVERVGSRRGLVRGSMVQVAVIPVECGVEDRQTNPASATNRRAFLAAQITAAATATNAAVPASAWAALAASAALPKDYTDKARTLVNTLSESLEFEASNPSDAKRFRKAEPAKEAVKVFIKDWASSPLVQGDVAHDDIILAVRELGAFYKANGSRKPLSPEARVSILAKLYTARDALPPAEKTLAEGCSGSDDVDDPRTRSDDVDDPRTRSDDVDDPRTRCGDVDDHRTRSDDVDDHRTHSADVDDVRRRASERAGGA